MWPIKVGEMKGSIRQLSQGYSKRFHDDDDRGEAGSCGGLLGCDDDRIGSRCIGGDNVMFLRICTKICNALVADTILQVETRNFKIVYSIGIRWDLTDWLLQLIVIIWGYHIRHAWHSCGSPQFLLVIQYVDLVISTFDLLTIKNDKIVSRVILALHNLRTKFQLSVSFRFWVTNPDGIVSGTIATSNNPQNLNYLRSSVLEFSAQIAHVFTERGERDTLTLTLTFDLYK